MMYKEIEFGDGRYSVSKYGLVVNTRTGRILMGNDIGRGYQQVTLCHNGLRKSFLIHILVGKAFVENPNNLPQINHKDKNTRNNEFENLEWASPSSNVKHSYDTGRELPSKKGRKYRALDNLQSQVVKSLIGIISIKQIARYFNVNRSTVRNYA